MILYHLEKKKYADVWPPEGTLFAEGRWNKPGQWVIYASSTISLAKLEILANENSFSIKRVCMTIEVSEEATIFNIKKNQLPFDWHNKPYPVGLADLTSRFLASGKLLMQVPSAQSYTESNYLINVRHQKFYSFVKLKKVQDEPFDPRLKTVR
ncbi:MAG: RES family NAD+ phosphorylase [Bacteroidota bacterium]